MATIIIITPTTQQAEDYTVLFPDGTPTPEELEQIVDALEREASTGKE